MGASVALFNVAPNREQNIGFECTHFPPGIDS